jgi:predicted MarR family transcription regulator
MDTITIRKNCVVTNKEYAVTVSREAFHRWQNGELATVALRELSRGDREFIISGISPEGWDITFSDDPEDDPEASSQEG